VCDWKRPSPNGRREFALGIHLPAIDEALKSAFPGFAPRKIFAANIQIIKRRSAPDDKGDAEVESIRYGMDRDSLAVDDDRTVVRLIEATGCSSSRQT